MTGQHPSLPFPASNAMPPEAIHAGANVCPLGYDTRFLSTAYPRIPELYGAGYTEHFAYINGLNPSHSVLYSGALPSPYDIKDPRTAGAWLPPGAGYSCDPAFAAYAPYGDRFDPVDSEARRRNATRETTSTLKAWLNEHRKNPYPTKGEKIMLAIITKMTLTQVSTWFANARRRLKKENKMTWEPRNKTGDDLDDVSVDEYEDKEDEDQKDSNGDIEKNGSVQSDKKESSELDVDVGTSAKKSEQDSDILSPKEDESQSIKLSTTDLPERQKTESTIPAIEKPKIWSLARTATSESPPISRKHPLENSQSDDLKRFRRMPPLYVEPFSNEECDPRLYFNHRNIPRLHPDSSAESSLSSPPSWRTTDIHALNHSDKYGRVTPLDSSDIVSVSPSSSGSPAIVTSSIDQRNSSSPSMAYSRFMGCRLFPSADGTASGLRPPSDHSQYFTTQANSLSHSLDLRTYHPTFLKGSPFGHPSSFGVPSLPHPHIQQSSPTTTASKGKENGSHSQSDS